MQENLQAVRLRVGNAIRRLRLEKDWSQEKLADLAGNNHKHLGQIERGEVNVTIDILTSIAGALAVDIGDLFRPETAPGTKTSRAADAMTAHANYTISADEAARLLDALRIVERFEPPSKE